MNFVLYCDIKEKKMIHIYIFLYQADWKALRGALVGCLALMRRKSTAGMVTSTDAKAAARCFLQDLQVQSLGQHDRKVIVFLSQVIVNGDIKFLKIYSRYLPIQCLNVNFEV